MTTLVCWTGADQRGPASLYLASDSRISWTVGGDAATRKIETWDHGRKVFCARNHPDLFGYVGDVLFPALVLSQVTALIDAGVLFATRGSADERFKALVAILKRSGDAVHPGHRAAFTVVYATRDGEVMNSNFRTFRLEWTTDGRWVEHSDIIPETSNTVVVLGSGSVAVSKWRERWERTPDKGTSRAIFAAFCDAVHAADDPWTGGGPQVVGLYRKGGCIVLGTVLAAKPYVLGIPLDDGAHFDTSAVEWRNAAFERCDAQGALLPNAQRHPAPKGLRRG